MERRLLWCPLCSTSSTKLVGPFRHHSRGGPARYRVTCLNCGHGAEAAQSRACAVIKWNKLKRTGVPRPTFARLGRPIQ